ncbi:MAG: TolC family protein, partial [Pseudomonadota bacterium]
MRSALPLIFALTLAGCVSNPEYYAPDLIEAVGASDGFVREISASPRSDTFGQSWWKTVGGSELDGLVAQMIKTSPSLEAARARVRQSRALSRQALANRLPSVTGSADVGELALLDPLSTPFMQSSTYTLSAAWNLDVFGQLRAAERAAQLRQTASELSQVDLQRGLISELSRAYVTAWALKQRIEISKGLADSFENTAQLTDDRYRLGSRTIGALDVQIARQNAYSAAADVPALEANYLIQVQAIDILLGRLPGTTLLSFDEVASATALPD